MKRQLLAIALIVAMTASALCGCSSGSAPAAEAPAETSAPVESTAQEQPSEAPASQDPAEVPVESEAPKELYVYDLPLTDKPATFTHWGDGAPPFITPVLGAEQSFNTAEATDYMEELTGIRVHYVEVDMFSKSEKFNLMVASEDYTDMVSTFDSLYSGGAPQAYKDEVILDLTEYVENNMPAYAQIVDEGGYRSSLLSDDGQYLYITGFNDEIYADNGPAIREDWLKALNLDIPETYDDWYEVGSAFRDNYGCSMAFYFTGSLNPGVWFSAGFDLPGFDIRTNGSHFYQIDGQVQSAYTQDSLKDMIKLVSQWYAEGLIGKDFISRENGQDCEADLFSDNVGIFSGAANFITEYNNMPDNKARGFHTVGIPLVKREEGQMLHFTSAATDGSGQNTLCITTNCEDPQLLTTFLDFQFTKQGQLLNNYGIEGKTYTLDENGDPQWLDTLVENGMGGIAFSQATVPYIINALPSYFDADRRDKVTLDEDSFAARDLYNQGFDGAYDLPFGMSFNEEETSTFYNRISDVDTYAAEYLLKCVYGENDIDATWDAYVDQLWSLGLQDCIDAKQTAYDRFIAR